MLGDSASISPFSFTLLQIGEKITWEVLFYIFFSPLFCFLLHGYFWMRSTRIKKKTTKKWSWAAPCLLFLYCICSIMHLKDVVTLSLCQVSPSVNIILLGGLCSLQKRATTSPADRKISHLVRKSTLVTLVFSGPELTAEPCTDSQKNCLVSGTGCVFLSPTG